MTREAECRTAAACVIYQSQEAMNHFEFGTSFDTGERENATQRAWQQSDVPCSWRQHVADFAARRSSYY